MLEVPGSKLTPGNFHSLFLELFQLITYSLADKSTCACNELMIISFTGLSNDYDNTVFFKMIPSSTTSRVVSQNIRINNDNINEIEQHFALVGELGPEIPDEFACFRVTFGEAECRGRVGATGIRIRDNDR